MDENPTSANLGNNHGFIIKECYCHGCETFTTCHNRTLMAVDLRLCDTHFSATSGLSLFVLVSPTTKRRRLESLAPFKKKVLENGDVLVSPTIKRRMLESLAPFKKKVLENGDKESFGSKI